MKFGTKEWSDFSFNMVEGCSHDCVYCYAKAAAIKRGIKTSENWKEEVVRPFKHMGKKDGVVMFPTQHDITPNTEYECTQALKYLLEVGNKVLLVSKPHYEIIKNLCKEFEEYKDSLEFRFTIGSTRDSTLKLWEPNAPDFEERFASLMYAHMSEFRTSVSCEPMLDAHVEDVVEKVSPFADEIWIGKPNFLEERVLANSCNFTSNAKILDNLFNDTWILDLVNRLKDNPKIKWKESIQKVIDAVIDTSDIHEWTDEDFNNSFYFQEWRTVYHKTLKLFDGNELAAKKWLVTPNKALNNKTPIDILRTKNTNLVDNLIGRLEHGVFS